MRIESLELLNYRNIKQFKENFPNQLNLFVGKNAQGKTNLLESIYIIGTTKSFRKTEERHLITFNEEYGRISAITKNNDTDNEVKIKYSTISKKQIFLNNKKISSLSNYLGKVLVVLFVPEDISIIKGEAGNRRRFIDILLCQSDKIYLHDLLYLQKILKQRNMLLKEIRKDKNRICEIVPWNEQLIQYSNKIYEKRTKCVIKMNGFANVIHNRIEKNENMSLKFIDTISNGRKMESETYQELFKIELKKRFQEEVVRGTTLLGPHRDDIEIAINNKPARFFGSQGQQRSIAISLRLAEIDYYFSIFKEYPVLLLDDVFSELDYIRREEIVKLLNSDVQIFITGTDIKEFYELLRHATLFYIDNGSCKEQ